MAGLDDEKRRTRANDSPALAKDHLDAARVLLAGELTSFRGRLDIVEVDHAALDLRHRLLRHDEDIARDESAGAPRGLGEMQGEVVSFLQLGDPTERDDADLAAHLLRSRPESLMPAWIL